MFGEPLARRKEFILATVLGVPVDFVLLDPARLDRQTRTDFVLASIPLRSRLRRRRTATPIAQAMIVVVAPFKFAKTGALSVYWDDGPSKPGVPRSSRGGRAIAGLISAIR